MNKNEKFLLLTDVPPCKNYTGGLMTSKLAKFLIEEKVQLCCFCVMDKGLNPNMETSVMNDIGCKFYEKPQENFEIPGFGKNKYNLQLKKLQKKLVDYIKKEKITKVWCTLQGEVMVSLLNTVRKNGIDYVAQIWDPIEWWIKENNFSEKRKEDILKEFGLVISGSSCCITSSFAMSKEYSSKYGIRCVEVMSPLDKPNIYTDISKKEKNKFIISISGQIYSKEETEKLLLALQSIGWKYKGKEIVFKYYGVWSDNYINIRKFNNDGKEHIQIMGFIPQHKLLQELSFSDLLYCPYFFSQEDCFKKVATMSFPSKLITYMSLKVSILVHAPFYSSPYMYIQKIKGGFLEDTLDIEQITKKIKTIIEIKDSFKKQLIRNSNEAFSKNFISKSVKERFFCAIGLKFDKHKKLRILEVNNVDLPGKRFNGFDLQQKINTETIHSAKQIVTYKTSNNNKVIKFFNTKKLLDLNEKLIENEAEFLSVHSQLSFTSNILLNHDEFINADLVHYHLIHNTKLSLNKMIDLCNEKPSVLTIHDPWNFTGRCVHPHECEKWKSGCKNCEYLENLFSLKEDNCNSLWKLKEKIYKKLDVDIIVTTPFMKKMLQKSPLTKHFKNIHLIPFGIDLEKFNKKISKKEARKLLHIEQNSIVLFFRTQAVGKGIDYILTALKELNFRKRITLLTCGEVGLLNELKDKYSIVDMGFVNDETMVKAYLSCDVFLMPSEGESFGLMAIEAMACSRPVVVFNNSALPDVTFAPKCGVLVENKNSHELMKAIKMLIENREEREKRGKLGRLLAEKNYNINIYEKRILELYEKVYERQKNKKRIKITKETINYSLNDVQFLIKKLRKIIYNLFETSRFDIEFLKNDRDIIFKNDYKIDYSIDSVQEVIDQFNSFIFDLIKKENNIDFLNKCFGEMIWYRKIIFLLKNDREKLKNGVKKRLKNYKVIYFLTRIIFKILRKIKRTLFNEYYKNITNDINCINKRFDSLEEENRKILNMINQNSFNNVKKKNKL